MNKYVICIHWSQTDIGHILVEAETRKEALETLKQNQKGFYHVMGCSKITSEIMVEMPKKIHWKLTLQGQTILHWRD